MSLDELKKLAREAEYGKSALRVHPATFLELCALLDKAEEALDAASYEIDPNRACHTENLVAYTLAAIKQWKEVCDGL